MPNIIDFSKYKKAYAVTDRTFITEHLTDMALDVYRCIGDSPTEEQLADFMQGFVDSLLLEPVINKEIVDFSFKGYLGMVEQVAEIRPDHTKAYCLGFVYYCFYCLD